MGKDFKDSPRQGMNGKLRELFIVGYLILAFGAYFLLFVFSRIDRIKGLLGL